MRVKVKGNSDNKLKIKDKKKFNLCKSVFVQKYLSAILCPRAILSPCATLTATPTKLCYTSLKISGFPKTHVLLLVHISINSTKQFSKLVNLIIIKIYLYNFNKVNF